MLSRTYQPYEFRDEQQYLEQLERENRWNSLIWKDYYTIVDGLDEDPVNAPLESAKKRLLATTGPLINARLHSDGEYDGAGGRT